MGEREGTLELEVADGPQDGARVSLSLGRAATVGSAFEDDVTLRDARVPPAAVRLVPTAEGCRIESLGDDVDADVDGTPLRADAPTDVALGAMLRLGGTRLVVGGRALVPHDAALAADVPASEAAVEGTVLAVRTSLRRRGRWLAVAGAGGLAALLVVLGVLHQQREAASAAALAAARPALGALLAAAGFDAVHAVDAGGAPRLGGFVASRAERMRLDALLERAGFDPAALGRDVVVGERLADSVAGVYRVHGVEAEVEALSADAVRVETALGDAARLARLEEAVRADVPGLVTIDVVDTPPSANVAPAEGESNDGLDAGKRVAMVVSGPAPHVLTEDGSRYFVGALLPNGQRIRAISDGRVTLARGDETIEMSF